MTKKKKSKAQSRPAGTAPPSGPDEFLALDNCPAERAMPDDLSAEAVTQRVWIRDSQPAARAGSRGAPAHAGIREILLPQGSGLGLPGESLVRMSAAEVARGLKRGKSRKADVEPYRPPWVDFRPHAKVGSASGPLMHRLNGALIEPFYGVFGNDDRQVYYPSGYPWHCVGKVLVWDDFSRPWPSWWGSGVLIGGRVVLTAGHVVPWASRNWAMQFIPAFYDGGSALGAGVSSWVSSCRGYADQAVSAWDMAVLRLHTPLGDRYGFFGTKDYDSDWEGGNYWTLAGYPGAVAGGNRPSRQMWWPVLDDDSDGSAEEVEFEADATPGNSGGPVFGFWSGIPYAIATLSGGSRTIIPLPFGLSITLEDTNVGAGGGALNNLVRWARVNWP